MAITVIIDDGGKVRVKDTWSGQEIMVEINDADSGHPDFALAWSGVGCKTVALGGVVDGIFYPEAAAKEVRHEGI